jgi:hypothetical protein
MLVFRISLTATNVKNTPAANSGGRCYGHNFLRFLPILGKTIRRFSQKKTMLWSHFFARTSSSLSKRSQFFRHFFRRKYFQKHNIGPGIT